MYKLLLIVFLSSSFLTGCNFAPTPEKKPDHTAAKKEIRTAFNNYKKAVLAQEGAKATQYITTNTLDYYTDLIDKIRFADKETVLGTSLADQTQILIARRFYSKEEILGFDGKQFYASIIDNNLVGGQLKPMSIGLVAIKGNEGKAQMVFDGTKTAIFFDFIKEENEWKIDITTTLIMTTKTIETEARKAGLPTTQYLLDMLQLEEKDREKIWEPLEVR